MVCAKGPESANYGALANTDIQLRVRHRGMGTVMFCQCSGTNKGKCKKQS